MFPNERNFLKSQMRFNNYYTSSNNYSTN